MVYTRIYDAGKLMQYIMDCINFALASSMYEDPHIEAAFILEGMEAIEAIQLAVNKYVKNENKANLSDRRNKVAEGKRWLDRYADMVEIIANADANRDTIQQAGTNISASFLTPRKIVNAGKPNPEEPELFGKTVGSGKVNVKVLNGATYKPMMTHFILLEKTMNAKIVLKNGALFIEIEKMGQVVCKTANSKGKFTHFTGLKDGVEYDIYAYAQNGNEQISKLSAKITV